MARSFLHLVELPLLLIELLLHLRHMFQLPRLIPVVRSLVLDAPAHDPYANKCTDTETRHPAAAAKPPDKARRSLCE